jgi:hypothetical protein
MKRVEANDAGSVCLLATSYHLGLNGFQQDQTTAMELYAREQILEIVRRITLKGRRYGRRRSGTRQSWSNGGIVWKHGTSCKTLDNCCISWMLSCFA